MNGLLIVNKPAGITSRKVVDRVESWFPGVRAGHAGTLDPLATGVLVVCLGSATRLIEYVQQMKKTYVATVRLGATSDSDDIDGHIETFPSPRQPGQKEVSACLDGFVGEIEQVPPAHSALRLDGRRAYELARKGQSVTLAARKARVDQIDLIEYAYPLLRIRVQCGKGTYIRSLARDIGLQLGCGGLIEKLERTQIGPFRVEDALDFDSESEIAGRHMLPLKAAVSDLSAITIGSADLDRLRKGQKVQSKSPGFSTTEIAVYDPAGELAAIARWNASDNALSPYKVL